MTTIPNPPTTGDEFTNELTGVTYRYDGSKWVAISAPIDGIIEDLESSKVDRDGDTMTGALDFQLGTKTSPQFAIAPNVVGAATNIFTTGGQLRLRTSHTEDINDRKGSHIILDPNGGDPVTSIYNVRDPVNNRDATPRIYVDGKDEELQGLIDDGIETQQEIIADVEILQNKVTALEGSVIDASWTFESDDRLPRAGEFALRGGGDAITSDWTSAQSIIISTTSNAGDTYTFDKVTINDVIRIGAADGSSAEYKVLTILDAGTYFVEHLRSTGTATDETEYAFTFLSAFDPEGLATIDYVDAQDETKVNKSGDSMSGNLTVQGASFYVKESSGTEKFRVQANGFCRTNDLFRAQRDDGGPALQGRIGTTLNAEIRCDGQASFKTSVKKDGKELATEEFVEAYVPEIDLSNLVTTNTSQTISSKKTFGNSHTGSIANISVKGRFQVNDASGSNGQVLTSQGTSDVVKWDSVVKSNSTSAGPGGFYESGGALYYRTR